MKWFNKRTKNDQTRSGTEKDYFTTTSQTTTDNQQHILLTSQQQQLIMQLPVFSGTSNENFMDFIEKINIMLDGYNNTQKMEVVLFRLNGKASKEYIKLNATTMEWNNFINTFKTLFPETNATTYQDLRKRKQQHGESLEAYAADIRRIINKFYNNKSGYNEFYRNNAMVKHFIANVNSNTSKHLQKCQLRKQQFNNLNDVLKEAQQHDQQIQAERRGPPLIEVADNDVSNNAPTNTTK